MAGHVRERKRWQRQDGPDGTLRRLRSQLAEDGCADSQVVLAKHLLQEADGVNGTEKEKDAVNWLLKAAEQNSEQATELLTECFYQKKGLTSDNYDKVHKYLNMGHQERISRTAAKELYNKLSPEGLITSKVLMGTLDNSKEEIKSPKQVDKIDKPQLVDDIIDSGQLKVNCDGMIYTEDDLLNLASKLATGQSLDRPVDWEEQSQKFKNFSWREKLQEPLQYYIVSYMDALEHISQNGPKLILYLITPNIYHLFIFLIIQCAEIPNLFLSSAPIILFYISFISMFVSTFQMLHLQKCLRSLQCWACILTLPVENSLQMESLFLWNHGNAPYIQYFSSVISLLFLYPLIPSKFVLASELTTFSVVMAITTFVAIGKINDWLVTTSVFMHLLFIIFPSVYLSLPISTYIGDWMFCAGYINLSRYIRLHVGFPGLFFLVIPVIFITMAVKNKISSYGLHRVVLPHFVCIFWWQLAATFFCSSSLLTLIRGSILIGGFFLFLPYLFFILGATAILWLVCSFFCKSVMFLYVLLAILPSILQNCTKLKNFVTGVKFVCYSIIIAFVLQNFCVSDVFSEQSEALVEWQYYYKFCHQPAWDTGFVAQVQYECKQLKGTKISWQGSVSRVNIVNSWNEVEQLLALFPSTLSSSLRCVFGAPYEDYCTQCDMKAFLHALKKNECHLLSWDVYKFELVVAVQTDSDWADIFVEAEDYFTPFMLRLQRSDEIIFNGSLVDGLGSSRPTIRLDGVECVKCANEMEPVTKMKTQIFDFSDSFRSVIHFVFSPLIECIC